MQKKYSMKKCFKFCNLCTQLKLTVNQVLDSLSKKKNAKRCFKIIQHIFQHEISSVNFVMKQKI